MTCSNPNCELGCAPLLEEHDPSSKKYYKKHYQVTEVKGSGGGTGGSWTVTTGTVPGVVTLTINGQPVYKLKPQDNTFEIKHNDSAADIDASLNSTAVAEAQESYVQYGEFQVGTSNSVPKGMVYLMNKKVAAELAKKVDQEILDGPVVADKTTYQDLYKWDLNPTGWAFKDSLVATDEMLAETKKKIKEMKKKAKKLEKELEKKELEKKGLKKKE